MFSPWDDLREAMRKKVIFYDPRFCTFIVVEIVKMVYPIPREIVEEFLKYYLASAITIFYKHTISAQTILLHIRADKHEARINSKQMKQWLYPGKAFSIYQDVGIVYPLLMISQINCEIFLRWQPPYATILTIISQPTTTDDCPVNIILKIS